MRIAGMEPTWLDAPAAERRSTVWQAVGVLNAALRSDSPTALALLRARACAQGSTVAELAEDSPRRSEPAALRPPVGYWQAPDHVLDAARSA
jgi:hypothetical protein